MADFKTIADFRKDNRKAIKRVCVEFVGVCRELELFSATLDRTQANIDRYLAKLDAVDKAEPEIREVTTAELKQKIASMEAKMEELKQHEVDVEAHPDNQVSLTDPDARSMMKAGGGSSVSYNVQTAVDSQHHLIAAHEVTNATSDRSQLSSMAEKARSALQSKALTVIADPGYYKGEEIVACYDAGITALVPKTNTSSGRTTGRYSKADFRYDAVRNEYICPAGEHLTYRFNSVERGQTLWIYMRNDCSSCALQAKCTTSNAKRLKRWEKEHRLDAVDVLLKKNPDAMRQRLVEHPYGTIKHWMGSTHFLMKRLPNVQAEMSLHVLAYTSQTCDQHSRRAEDHGTTAEGLMGPHFDDGFISSR
jgi:hypothetical protein